MIEETFPYADFKSMYIDVVEGRSVVKLPGNKKVETHLSDQWRSSGFYGATSDQVVEWLRNGYRVEGFTLDPPIHPVRKRRRLIYGEEGELQLDLAWSGHDYPFLDWEKRDIMPGMHIDIELDFNGSVSSSVIAEYGRWVLRALVALEKAGIDLEVWITSGSHSLTARGGESGRIHYEVKKSGEQMDYLGWSVMLSPGAFRHFHFLGYTISCDMNGRIVSSGFGTAMSGNKFSVSFSPDNRSLRFNCPGNTASFPENEMEMQLREVLKQARRAA
jgi:hypothetical protein